MTSVWLMCPVDLFLPLSMLPAWLKWTSLFQESSLIFVRRERTLCWRLRLTLGDELAGHLGQVRTSASREQASASTRDERGFRLDDREVPTLTT